MGHLRLGQCKMLRTSHVPPCANLESLQTAWRISVNIREHIFPETCAGGHSCADSTVEFDGRVNALLRSERIERSYGAEKGAMDADPAIYRRGLLDL